jgi:hypothetical protein
MADLLYFLAGKPSISRADLAAAGAPHAMPDRKAGLHQAQMQAGPSGGPGAVGTVENGDLQAADRHQWLQFPNSTLWVGVNPEDPPDPEELARAHQMSGHLVELADGQEWLVPVARMLDGATPLPRRLACENGKWIGRAVLPKYADLFSAACRFWDALIAADGSLYTYDDEVNLAAQALAINYRLSPIEISLLGLFSTASEAEVCKAVIDWPAFEAIKKKLAPAEASLPPGAKV